MARTSITNSIKHSNKVTLTCVQNIKKKLLKKNASKLFQLGQYDSDTKATWDTRKLEASMLDV